MSDQKPTLDYAPPPDPKPWPTWVVFAAMFLWPLIVIDIWSGAFISVVFTVLGVVNLFHPVSGLGTEGPGTIRWTKASWLICNALLDLRAAGHLALALEKADSRSQKVTVFKCLSGAVYPV